MVKGYQFNHMKKIIIPALICLFSFPTQATKVVPVYLVPTITNTNRTPEVMERREKMIKKLRREAEITEVNRRQTVQLYSTLIEQMRIKDANPKTQTCSYTITIDKQSSSILRVFPKNRHQECNPSFKAIWELKSLPITEKMKSKSTKKTFDYQFRLIGKS